MDKTREDFEGLLGLLKFNVIPMASVLTTTVVLGVLRSYKGFRSSKKLL